MQHPWSGNVRELENLIQRFVILGDEQLIVSELLSAQKTEPVEHKALTPTEEMTPSLKEIHREAIKNAELQAIRKALEFTNWNRKKAAGMLNISYKALLYKIKAYHLDKKTFSISS